MIRKCAAADAKAILDFIGDDYGRCLYLYMDLLKYGFETPFVSVWREDGTDGAIASVWLRYNTGMHVYAPRGLPDGEAAIRFVRSERPAMLCGVSEVLLPIADGLKQDGYQFSGGRVGRYALQNGAAGRIDFRSLDDEADFTRVEELLYADEEYGASYKPGELAAQLFERRRQGLSRNYAVERQGRIVAHVGTGAECDRFALLSGGVTDREWRRHGLFSGLITTLAQDLLAEGKDVFSLYYNSVAAALHHKAGFVDQCTWGRLFLKLHP